LIHKTRGIVFRFTKFRETSIIVTIFTDLFGLQSYMVNGVRSKSSKNKIALYQPLTLLDLVVYHREHANIERIKEVRCLYPFTTLTTDVKKLTIGMFIQELLNKAIRHESHAKELFDFLFDALTKLDLLQSNSENFHLVFMIRLARHLGFGPQQANEIVGGRIADEETEKALSALLGSDYHDNLNINIQTRRNVLDLLAGFYNDHMDLGEIKSIQVLREVLT
jgi:DNA repair protein RecO (recombination protein O)